MSTLNVAVSAQINGKEQPNKLYVHGSVLVYTQVDEVEVREADTQGINVQIHIIEVKVHRKDAPMKGQVVPFLYEKEVDGRQYDQVTVRFDDGSESTVVVSYLG
jgi:hypothetical protein